MIWPFDKPIGQLREADLSQLAGKQEAFTFDYKSAEFIGHPKNIAKHVASFANHYGGWLFIGISADATTNEPRLPPQGVSPTEARTETVYSAVMDNLSPAPLVAVQLVGITGGNSVIVVHIDESQDTPHIHKPTGRIFVRSGNVTDWVEHVRDRHDLELLYQRGRRAWEAALERAAGRGFGQTLWRQLQSEAKAGKVGAFMAVFPLAASADLLPGLHQSSASWAAEPFLRHFRFGKEAIREWHWQHGVTFVQPQGAVLRGALVATRYGHIEAAWLSTDNDRPETSVDKRLCEVLQFAQNRLKEAGYLGRIGVVVSVVGKDGERTRVNRLASVGECTHIDTAELVDELRRGADHPEDWTDPLGIWT